MRPWKRACGSLARSKSRVWMPPNYRRADKLVEQGCEMFPGLAGGEISRWMGHRPCLPDSVPVIGPSTRVKETFFAFGHGHIGLTCAATTGRVTADLSPVKSPVSTPRPTVSTGSERSIILAG